MGEQFRSPVHHALQIGDMVILPKNFSLGGVENDSASRTGGTISLEAPWKIVAVGKVVRHCDMVLGRK